MSESPGRDLQPFPRPFPQPFPNPLSGQLSDDCGGRVHFYPRAAIIGDLLRASAGCGFTGVPLVQGELNGWVSGVLGALFGLFATFALLTAIRSRMKIVADARGVTVVRPWPTRIDWAKLDGLTLNYYATDPKKDKGWMHLVLKCSRRRIKVDSRLEGFVELARQALDAAGNNELTLGDSTLANFSSLGVTSKVKDEPDNADREGALN